MLVILRPECRTNPLHLNRKAFRPDLYAEGVTTPSPGLPRLRLPRGNVGNTLFNPERVAARTTRAMSQLFQSWIDTRFPIPG